MRQPRKENPLEEFIRSTTNMVKKNPRISLVVGSLWLVNLLVCLVLAGVWFVGSLPSAQSTGVSATSAPTPTSIAALPQEPDPAGQVELPPTPDCGQQVLTIGETRLQVESLARAADGSIPVPPDSPGTAYRVADSGLNDLFALSPSADNLALVSALQAGMAASLGSQNCNTTLYTLSAPIPGPVDMAALGDQSAPGLVLFIAGSADSPGITLQGEPSKLIFSGEATPPPGAWEVEAQVSFLETTISGDGSIIKVSIEIYNYGSQAFTLTSNDVVLIPEGAEPLAPGASEPGLPREFKPKEREAFDFTFPNPGNLDAVFKIFTVEINLIDFQ